MPYTPEEVIALQEETHQERAARLRRALLKLPDAQRAKIDELAVSIVAQIKRDHPLAIFSLDNAYELLASLGVWWPQPKEAKDGD